MGRSFDITITGKGVHGARPESSIDPIVAASQIVMALQTIVSRSTCPVDTAVLSVTQLHAGDAYNVIPQTARLSGTVRAFSNQAMALVEARMKEIVNGIGVAMGATVMVDFRNIFKPTINDHVQADYPASVCCELVGTSHVDRNPPLIMASEDFSFMLEKVPGCYINIGNGGNGADVCEVHNPGYDVNDDALPFGAAFFARLVERKLAP